MGPYKSADATPTTELSSEGSASAETDPKQVYVDGLTMKQKRAIVKLLEYGEKALEEQALHKEKRSC